MYFQLAIILLLLLLLPHSMGNICRPGYLSGYFGKCFDGGFCIVRGDICINGECCRPKYLQGCPVGTWPNGRCRNTANCRNSCVNDICCQNVANVCDACAEEGTLASAATASPTTKTSPSTTSVPAEQF